MTFRKALLAATVLALPVAAQAQPVSGLYVGAGAGLNWHQDSEATFRNIRSKVQYDTPGFAGVASLGWGFGNGFRAEVEGNYRENEVRKHRLNGATATELGGNLRQYGVMVNALYDFQTGTPFMPYLGAGVGYGWVETDSFRGRVGNTRFTSSDTDGSLAYQGIAGVGYSLNSILPGLALTAEYRFYGTVDPSLNATVRNAATNVGIPPNAGRVKYEPDNYNHSLLLGVRYAFNAAPPPPPPPVVAPAPAPATVARTYLVFFDWDRADLTDRARQIISEAAAAAPRVQTTRIEVAGHADRSGTPQYNQRLSQRRADAVAAELVRRGITRDMISVSAYGESRPLVPTADGVREPQNRRVEIVLR